MTTRLALSSPGPVTASPSARTIEGLAVPYGPAGRTSAGTLTFGPGALSWSDPKRVKLLLEHDQRSAIGYAVELDERDDGLHARFHIPAGEDGDRALSLAANGVRDAFSVGVQLDEASETRLRRSQGRSTAGTGALREVSLVSVPAFDDARVGAVAHADLVVSAWSDPTMEGSSTVPDDQRADVTPSTSSPVSSTAPAATPDPVPAQASAPADPQTGPAAGEPPRPGGSVSSSGPSTVRAAAGAAHAHVSSDPSTYAFDGSTSLVRDAYAAGTMGDRDAADRLARFNSELANGNPSSVEAFVTAAVGVQSDHPSAFYPDNRRPLLTVVDAGRPIVSRIPAVPITNATPFLVPVEGEFSGVADHTEGEAHVAEGTLTTDEATVTPRAISGAYRVSRELVDSSNPAIDRLAVAAMLRDYRRNSEDRLIAALRAATPTDIEGVDTVLELRRELASFVSDDDTMADLAAVSPAFLEALSADVDSTGRPHLPYVGPQNAVGTNKAGFTGASVDGIELVRASRVAANEAYLIRSPGVLWAESNVQQFRFDQVEGPGIIKLALWAYAAAAVLRVTDVARLTTATGTA